MPERILITGGSGFVGACLARDLIAAGHDVHLLLRPQYKNWRLADVEGQYTPHWADLRDGDAVRQSIVSSKPEVIYHLATHGAYPTQKNRPDIMATNLQGTINLIEALAKHDYRALVQAGSSSEYGHKSGAMREDDLIEPRSDYGISKAAASHFCLAEAYRGRPACVVRLFSVYGPWEEPNRLVPYVMGCCLRNENPRVTAGSQPRDFIYVDDAVSLLKIAAHQPGMRGKILHAASGVQSRVRDMIEAIIAVSGKRVKAQYGAAELKPDEPERWVASIERTKALTPWQPRHDLASGLRSMWAWYQSWSARKNAA